MGQPLKSSHRTRGTGARPPPSVPPSESPHLGAAELHSAVSQG